MNKELTYKDFDTDWEYHDYLMKELGMSYEDAEKYAGRRYPANIVAGLIPAWLYDYHKKVEYYGDGKTNDGKEVLYIDTRRLSDDELKDLGKHLQDTFGKRVAIRTARSEYAPEQKKTVIVIDNKIEEGVSKDMTPEEIAKKHKVSVDKINKQLEKGIKVEKEHTKDEKKARRIALDHLFEIPDYYDRLNKMEKGALKEDTIKTKSGKWVNKGKEGTHGTFKTKKEADAQRKAMFSNKKKGAKWGESLEEGKVAKVDGMNILQYVDNLMKTYNMSEEDAWHEADIAFGIGEVDESIKEGKDAQRVIDKITRAKLKGLDEVVTDALESGYIEKKLDELYGWQLAALWSMCMLSEENDYSGQPYDDEVYDAISKRRDSENIFELANEIYAKFFKKSKNESLKESSDKEEHITNYMKGVCKLTYSYIDGEKVYTLYDGDDNEIESSKNYRKLYREFVERTLPYSPEGVHLEISNYDESLNNNIKVGDKVRFGNGVYEVGDIKDDVTFHQGRLLKLIAKDGYGWVYESGVVKDEPLKESISIDDELVEGIYYILKKGVTQHGEDFDFEHNDKTYNCNIEESYEKGWMEITIVDVEENEIVMVETYPAPPYNDNTDEELWNASMDIAERIYNELDSLTESIGGFLKYRNWLRKNGKKDNEESYYGYLQDTDSAFKSMPERDRRTQVQNMFSHRYMNPVTEGNEIKRKIKEYPRGSMVPEYLWTAVCNKKYDRVKKYFESGKEPNKRYPRFGGESSLIMGALRNGDLKMVDLLKSFGETIIDDEKKEYDTIMKRLSK